MDLYLYQVSLTREMKITWKLVRNSLYTVYLSEIHCKDVWQFPKWITGSGVVPAPSHIWTPHPNPPHLHTCTDMHSKAKHRGIPTGCLQASVRLQDAGSGLLKLLRNSEQVAGSLWWLALALGPFPPRNRLSNWWDNEHYRGAGVPRRPAVVQVACAAGSLSHCQVHIS